MPLPPAFLPRALCPLLLLVGVLVLPYRAAAELRQERTLAPYFALPTATEGVDALPLKASTAVVDIVGVIADVKVTQTYQNTGPRPLEAVYVFPGSTRAAVYSLTMRLGDRVRLAKIQERQTARAMYQSAKAAGKSASLLEQQRPNVFQMQVANILPGDEITVELAYTELLTPTEGTYTFLYPTIVGPRYATPAARHAPAGERWLAQPYLQAGTPPPYEFRLAVNLTTGVPVQKIASPSHKVTVAHQEPSRATITLVDTERAGGNRDFLVTTQVG